MHAPLYSTITLFAELLVSAAVYYTLYAGYAKNRFPAKLAWGAVAYEILFNISYMAFRVSAHDEAKPEPAFDVALAATHGILSLIMFIALIVFFLYAWRGYRRGENFFKTHPALTGTFGVLWAASVISGILFYVVEYV